MTDIDQKLFSEILAHAKDIRAMYATRDTQYDEYEKMYLMRWDDADKRRLSQIEGVRLVQSPDARNAVLGATRLLIASDPSFSIRLHDGTKADKLERLCSRMWAQSGRIAQNPLHYDGVLSAMLYGEMHYACNLTTDLVASAKKSVKEAESSELRKTKAYAQARLANMERLAARTPTIIECINPRYGYPEYSSLGMTAYYREAKVKVSELLARFPLAATSLGQKSLYSAVTLCSWYDEVYACYWVDGECLYLDEHGLGRPPVCATTTDGSNLFANMEDRSQPLLYTLYKSNLYSQLSLLLSVIFTGVFAAGATPQFKHIAPPSQPDKVAQIDFSKLIGVWELESGEDIQPVLNRGIIDPGIREAMGIAGDKVSRSTIFDQALGAPINGNSTFSAIALLAQSGRLPLIGTKQRGAWGIGDVTELALHMMRISGANYSVNNDVYTAADIDGAEQVDVKLEIDLPQDRLQLANIGSMLKDKGLVDDDWIRENILNVTDSTNMTERIWSQRAQEAKFIQMLQQMEQEQQTPPVMPNPMGNMQQPPQQMPPEMQAGAMMGGDASGMGGLPGAQLGMMPGAGQGAMPGEAGLM